MFRLPILATALVASLPVLTVAQPGPQEEPPTFRATTRLVEFTVVALDKKGNPVTDLRKEDFRVLDNGTSRDIVFFRFEGSAEEEAQPAPAPEGLFSNRIEYTGGPVRHVTALLLDTLNTDPNDQMFVKGQTFRFLQALAPETRVAVYQIGREFRILHDFNDPMQSLRAQLSRFNVEFQHQTTTNVERMAREAEEMLEQMAGAKNRYRVGASAAIYERSARRAIAGEVNYNTRVRGNRLEMTLAMLEALGRHISGVPGRKSLIWISSGVAMTSPRVSTSSEPRRINPALGANYENALRRTAERLAQSGVVLYTVDARGLTSMAENLSERQYPPPSSTGPFRELENADAYGRDTRAAFELMTGVTGGRSIYYSNDFSDGIRNARADLRGTYSLAFYAPAEPDAKWHGITAKVARSGVRVVHRKGYYPAGTDQPFSRDELTEAMASPLGSSAIRIDARCVASTTGAGGLDLSVQIAASDLWFHEVDGGKQAELDVVVGERLPGGKVQFSQEAVKLRVTDEQLETARRDGVPYRRTWKPNPDTAGIRVLVRDSKSGQFGTVDIPLSEIGG